MGRLGILDWGEGIVSRRKNLEAVMGRKHTKSDTCSVDSGMIVVIFISLGYLMLVFGLLFYVKNEWCDLLFSNFTVIFMELNKIDKNELRFG